MTQFTFFHARSDDIYSLPPKYVKNNETIILGNIWNNLIINIAEHLQFINDDNFDEVLNKFMYNDENDSYGYIPTGTDFYVIDEKTTDQTYYVLPGIQPRKIDTNNPNDTGSSLPATHGDSVDYIRTLQYGHNRTRVMKQYFRYYSSWILGFLFDNENYLDIFFSKWTDDNGITHRSGPKFMLQQIPDTDSIEEPTRYSSYSTSTYWRQFVSDVFNNISYFRNIPDSSHSSFSSVLLSYNVDRYQTNNIIMNTYSDRTDEIIFHSYNNNIPTFQYITINISTLDYRILVGNPNGTYYILEPYSSNTIIIPNPLFTINEFGKSRYYYFFTDDDITGNSGKVKCKFKIVAVDDSLNEIQVSDDEYVAVINSLETSPDIKDIQLSYLLTRNLEMVDTMYTTLTLYNYMIPILYHYFNIVSVSFDIRRMISDVKWFLDISKVANTTFSEFIVDYYNFKETTNNRLNADEAEIADLDARATDLENSSSNTTP